MFESYQQVVFKAKITKNPSWIHFQKIRLNGFVL